MDAGGAHYNGFPLSRDYFNASHEDYRVPRCLQERKTGICRARIPRWHYDHTSASCQPFTYGGCQGNENNFPTEQHCRAVCPDEIPCPGNPFKVCRVSESTCVTATCPLFPSAICFVLPCSCQTLFVDEWNVRVRCTKTTTTTTTTTTATDAKTTKPDVTTTSSVPGGDEEDQKGSGAVRSLVVVLLVMAGFGFLVLLLSVVVGRCRAKTRRTESTTRLHEPSEEDSLSDSHHNARVPIFEIL
ncbi:papilin-like isoform X2 [Eriocheir sinensis]|nr:papilin-like isoform X2 [Eriocheir sinensis]XP_050721775.1 papilin-like isoform X2 [Eriocheir sinensis]